AALFKLSTTIESCGRQIRLEFSLIQSMLRPLILRTLITNFGLTFLGLVNSVVLSRWLGPTGRGEIAAAMLWPTMLVYLSSMGLIMATMYFAALPESRPNSLFANATLFGIAQGTLA